MPSWVTSVGINPFSSYCPVPVCDDDDDDRVVVDMLCTSMLSIAAGSTIPIQKERNVQQIVEFQPKNYREAPDLVSEGGSGGNSSSTSSVSLQYTAVRPISDFVGNYFYASPEIVSGTGLYDQSVDWWAVGVMLFHVLAGITPFEDKDEQKDITLGTLPYLPLPIMT